MKNHPTEMEVESAPETLHRSDITWTIGIFNIIML